MKDLRPYLISEIKKAMEGIDKFTRFLNHKDEDVRNNAKSRIVYFEKQLIRSQISLNRQEKQ